MSQYRCFAAACCAAVAFISFSSAAAAAPEGFRFQDIKFLRRNNAVRIEIRSNHPNIGGAYRVYEENGALCCEITGLITESRTYEIDAPAVSRASVVSSDGGGSTFCFFKKGEAFLKDVQAKGGELELTIEESAGVDEAGRKGLSGALESPAAGVASEDGVLSYFLSYHGEEYRVGPGDVLQISVFQHPELSMQVAVPADGYITIPLLGPIRMTGRTIAEAQKAIYDGLAGDFFVNPQVTVNVTSYESQWVFVGGAVRAPGKIILRGPMTLADAVAAAGGIHVTGLQKEPSTLLLSRGEGNQTKILRVPVKDLLEAPTSIYQKVYLKNGDTVEIPLVTGSFYVSGEVAAPGVYPFSENLTVSRAVVFAHGFTQWSNTKEVEIIRRASEGQQIIRVNLKRVMAGKERDVVLQPEDMVVVRRRKF